MTDKTWSIGGTVYRSLAELRDALETLDGKARDRKFTDAERSAWNALNEAVEEAEREVRHARIRELAQDPANCEPGFSGSRRSEGSAVQSRALATIDRYTRSDDLSADAADRLDHHVRKADPRGVDAGYLAAVGDPADASAFAKILADPTHGHLRHDPSEVEAMRAVARAEAERAAMAVGAGATGGFAVPLTLDPSILMSSDGALCPIRQVARVETISTYGWNGVSSDGVVASYDSEAAEVSDDSPTLVQPSITTAMARAFVPFSMELGDDYAGLTAELTRLIADARDVLDSEKFYGGSGTDEPEGVITGLTASEKIETTASNVFALEDLWRLRQAVAPRWKASASWAMNPDSADVAYLFIGGADPDNPPVFSGGREGPLLGRALMEWTDMTAVDATPADNEVIAFLGDFAAAYTIVDRLGMTVELVPHLFATANNLPSGQRGLFARWRTGAAVVNANALRYLSTKPA